MIILYVAIGLAGLVVVLILASIISWDLRWAMLMRKEQMPTETLKKNHDDWWKIFSWIPRRFTAFLNGSNPKHYYPKQLFGTNRREFRKGILEQDVPEVGTWCVSWPPHFSTLTYNGTLIRFGLFRKDYWDGPEGYWTFLAFAWHKN